MKVLTSVLVSLFVALGCGGTAAAPSAVPTPPPTASAAEASPSPTTRASGRSPWSGSLTVDGGREVRGKCSGTEQPLVVAEGFDWPQTMVDAIAREATFCQYETDAVVGPQTAVTFRSDAWMLVDEIERASGVPGPVIFMGWSIRATKALGIASAHPERVGGLVILDVDFPVDFFATCPTWGWTDAKCQAEYALDKDAKDLDGAVAADVRPMPGIPIKLIWAMSDDCTEPADGQPLRIQELTAPDCAGMSVALADRAKRQWTDALGPQVEQMRLMTSHGALPFDGEFEVTAMVLEAVAEAKQRALAP